MYEQKWFIGFGCSANTITTSNDRFTTNSRAARNSALQIPERKVSLCPTSSHDAGSSDETSSTPATKTTTIDRLLMDTKTTESVQDQLEAPSSTPGSKPIPVTPMRTGGRFFLSGEVDGDEDDEDSSSFHSDGVNPFEKSSSPRSVTADIMTSDPHHHKPRRDVLLQKCTITKATTTEKDEHAWMILVTSIWVCPRGLDSRRKQGNKESIYYCCVGGWHPNHESEVLIHCIYIKFYYTYIYI